VINDLVESEKVRAKEPAESRSRSGSSSPSCSTSLFSILNYRTMRTTLLSMYVQRTFLEVTFMCTPHFLCTFVSGIVFTKLRGNIDEDHLIEYVKRSLCIPCRTWGRCSFQAVWLLRLHSINRDILDIHK